jgi:hypothetical protein
VRFTLQVTVKSKIPEDAFELDEAEVDAVKYETVTALEQLYRAGDASLVPADLESEVRAALLHGVSASSS